LKTPVDQDLLKKAKEFLKGKTNISVSVYGQYLKFIKRNDIQIMSDEEVKINSEKKVIASKEKSERNQKSS
tara:strand:+ start:100 stop:312 length:213 start_codon:yes stop_codon:yes gene_type:complete